MKWIKQRLRIKVFFGLSESAVKTEIVTAISTHVLIAIKERFMHLKHHGLYEIPLVLSLSIFETTFMD
ncbi:hypothetical protein [Rhodoferax ferrireducens]|uniref:hypothetical protein n=1 Tax=Rhodoferax ferrireducens TaxID=192843 RepID=UPI000059BE80|nr:hypothetical protein [Rhodoferax ferrireducens]